MVLNEDKLRFLLESYNVQQRECGDLQVQLEQKEAEIQLKAKQIERSKMFIEEELKIELFGHRKVETKILENLKNLEREIKFERSDKNESYLKILAAEDSIRGLREKDRRNLRGNIQDLEKCAFDSFKQRSSLRQVIKASSMSLAPADMGATRDGQMSLEENRGCPTNAQPKEVVPSKDDCVEMSN